MTQSSAIAIAIGQTITLNTIVQALPEALPDVNPASIIAAGATNLPEISQSTAILDVLRGIWNLAISRTMIVSLAGVCAAVPFTVAMEWLNAKKVAASKRRVNETSRQGKAEEEASKHFDRMGSGRV